MAQYGYPQQQGYGAAQNLQFYQSSYGAQPVSGHSTPFQAYNGGAESQAYGQSGFGSGFATQGGVSGRMGEQGGLRTGWLAAFGTEGYDGEPPLMEELGVNFGHIRAKVSVDIDFLIIIKKKKYRLCLVSSAKPLEANPYCPQTLAVLNPIGRIDQHIMDDSDLAGPILFFLLFGTFLLFVSKLFQ